MPPRFDTVEVLHHAPPFPASLIEELGLQGMELAAT
jgi:hypothetical protein